MPLVLRLAAFYHLALFAAIWVAPEKISLTRLDAAARPFAIDFWRAHAIGTSFGLGLGLLLASLNPLRQWAAVAAAFSICAWMVAVAGTLLPWWHVLLGYALWLLPLGLILRESWENFLGQQRVACPDIQRMAMRSRTSLGVSLDELSRMSPVMVVFLRHLGCPFCREALADLASQRARIEQEGTRLLFVHLSSEDELLDLLPTNLLDVARLADPNQTVYRAFGLGRGRLMDVFGPAVWSRFVRVLFRRGCGLINRDIFQMPGVFLVYHGQVIRSFRHQKISDRPDYLAIADDSSQPEYQGS